MADQGSLVALSQLQQNSTTKLFGLLKMLYTATFLPFRFRILTPMLVGFSNTVNSLYNVKQMVYSKYPVATLSTLRMALMNNWGEK